MKTKTIYSEGGTRTLYTYDDAGHQIRMTDYDADGRVTSDCLYRNNDEGDVLGWEVLDGAGGLICRFEVDYNPQGLASEEREYDAGGSLVMRTQYDYDSDGRISGERDLDAEGHPISESAA